MRNIPVTVTGGSDTTNPQQPGGTVTHTRGYAQRGRVERATVATRGATVRRMIYFARVGIAVVIGVAASWIVFALLRLTPLDSVNLGAAVTLSAFAGVYAGEWLAEKKRRHHLDVQRRQIRL